MISAKTDRYRYNFRDLKKESIERYTFTYAETHGKVQMSYA